MTLSLGASTLGLYTASLAFYWWFLYSNKRLIGRLATAGLGAGIVVHFQALLDRARMVHTVPYDDLYGSMLLLAWFLAVTYLGLEMWHRQRSVGPFVLPCAILLLLVTWLGPQAAAAPPPARGPLFALHVTANILAYAAFSLSFVFSVIYLVQNRLLRHHRLGTVVWKFPALDVLEGMSRSSVLVGIVSLTIGMSLGFLWVERLEGSLKLGDAKVIVSFLILALYVAYWWLSRDTAWRGARASVVSVANFLVVLFSYTVVNLFLTRYHRYF